jgi:butyryl-CoA dehydrogenase
VPRSWSTPKALTANERRGWRGTTSSATAAFQHVAELGEGKLPRARAQGAIGHLVGQPGDGLRCMFHMMNEARIAVGLGRGDARLRRLRPASTTHAPPQGRPTGPCGKEPRAAAGAHHPPRRREAHAARAEESYCEGAAGLEAVCARLVDELHTGEAEASAEARLLLEMLTAIAKSWPSEWCLEANSWPSRCSAAMATRATSRSSKYWRDNRLNMITRAARHPGGWTCSAQGGDDGGRGMALLGGAGASTRSMRRARAPCAVARTPRRFARRVAPRARQGPDGLGHRRTREAALAHAAPYMQAFGHTVLPGLVAWRSPRSRTWRRRRSGQRQARGRYSS